MQNVCNLFETLTNKQKESLDFNCSFRNPFSGIYLPTSILNKSVQYSSSMHFFKMYFKLFFRNP